MARPAEKASLDQWYVIDAEADIPAEPRPNRLLGRNLQVARDPDGTVVFDFGSGVEQLAGLVNRIWAGELRTFPQFIAEVEVCEFALGPSLRSLHGQIYEAVCAGDPTPFKAFRYNEFLATLARMGHLPELGPFAGFPVTRDPDQPAKYATWPWNGRRWCIDLRVSDKPDEASIPSTELQEQGFVALHQKRTQCWGVDCSSL